MKEILDPLTNYPGDLANKLVVENAFGYLLRGGARMAEGRKKEGIADLENAKKLDPQDGHVCMTLGTALKDSDPLRSVAEYELASLLFSRREDIDMALAARRAAERGRASAC